MLVFDHIYDKTVRCTCLQKTIEGLQRITTEHGEEMVVEEYLLTPSDSSVIDFIKLVRSKIEKKPQCWIFAALLKEKFPSADIYDDCHHVITKIYGAYYDWDGITIKENHIPLKKYGDNWLIRNFEAANSN